MLKNWWKILGFLLVLYSIFMGLHVDLPYDEMLKHTTRNVFYHVPMWFTMLVMYTTSFVFAILYLNSQKTYFDLMSLSFAKIGTVFGILGILTGMIWARSTWNTFWNNDPKLIGAAVTLLIYFALFILRSSVKDEDKRGIISAVYSVFAFFLMIPAIYIIPKYMASSHPGGATDESFMVFKMMPELRRIFYPAVFGWILIGVWISQLKYKIYTINDEN